MRGFAPFLMRCLVTFGAIIRRVNVRRVYEIRRFRISPDSAKTAYPYRIKIVRLNDVVAVRSPGICLRGFVFIGVATRESRENIRQNKNVIIRASLLRRRSSLAVLLADKSTVDWVIILLRQLGD